MLIAKPAAPLGGLAEGAEQAFGGHVFTDAHRVVPVSGSAAGDRPLERVIGALDASFVVGVMLSLIAVLMGCDLVAGEKARGTLRLTFANALGRRRWFAAKLSARLVTFWGLVGLGAARAWAVTGGVPLGAGWAWRLGAWAALSGLYLAAWVIVGAACSVAAPRPASAALSAIACWIVLVAVAPRALVALAEAADPAPATAPSRMALQVEEVRIGRAQMAMVEAATRRGELKGASSITAAEGGAAIREAIDARAARARAQEEAPLTAWRASQLQRLSALSYASPAALYFQAAAGIAGTDDRRHGAFVEQAGEYRHAFLERLNALEDRGVKTFEGYDAMPRFAFSEAGPTAVARAVAGPLAALLAFAAALAALSLGLMRRADLR
jgi:ABC-2 type transport system permease protein